MKVLILGGGGTLGAFSAGALRALEEARFVPDAWIGSSAGGINLLRCMVGGASAAVRFWRDNARLTTLARGLLHGKNLSEGILDPLWFHGRVERGVDFERLLRDPRHIGFLVVDLETGQVAVRGNRTEPTAADLQAVSRGAYALPPLLPPVSHHGVLLADGGLLHNAPLNAAVELGATSIVYVCNVHTIPRAGFAGARRPTPARASWRYAEIFFRRASNVGFSDAEIVDGRFRDVPFLAITPPAHLAFGSLLRWMVPTVDAVKHLVDCGYDSARRALRARRSDDDGSALLFTNSASDARP